MSCEWVWSVVHIMRVAGVCCAYHVSVDHESGWGLCIS